MTATAELLDVLCRLRHLYPVNGHGPMVVQQPHLGEIHRLLPLAVEEQASRAAEMRPEARFGSWAYNAASLCSASFYGAGKGPGVDVAIHDPFQPFGAQGRAVNAVEIPAATAAGEQEVAVLWRDQ